MSWKLELVSNILWMIVASNQVKVLSDKKLRLRLLQYLQDVAIHFKTVIKKQREKKCIS